MDAVTCPPGYQKIKAKASVSTIDPPIPYLLVVLMNLFPRLALLFSPFKKFPMASSTSYNYSTSSSSATTPRSSSPSSITSRSSNTTVSKRMSLSSRRISGPFNPLAGVDIDAIEAQMKMSALDGLRGYAQDHYGVVRQENRTEYVGEERARGVNVLREPGWNKGSSPLSFH
jgi:hypothetical protein